MGDRIHAQCLYVAIPPPMASKETMSEETQVMNALKKKDSWKIPSWFDKPVKALGSSAEVWNRVFVYTDQGL